MSNAGALSERQLATPDRQRRGFRPSDRVSASGGYAAQCLAISSKPRMLV